MNFDELGLNSHILKSIKELGFETPTEIQEQTIPAILESGEDLIGLAQTGTGKTAAFGLPLVNQVDTKSKKIQALILSPTRELGLQITKDLIKFATNTKNLKVLPVYGGASIVAQIKDLKTGCQIVVGTPGRTVDLLKRKVLKLDEVKYLVLDEADEMLNMGFKEDLDTILSETPRSKQTLLYSATMPKEIRKIASEYMNNPTEITVGKKNIGAENVSHQYYLTKSANKYITLKRIIDVNPKIYCIVFCRTRRDTKEISDKLMQEGYNADALHGDLSQSQRDFVMDRFRLKHLQILVATDVAARGLDVNELTHVINYNLPDDNESYIHRSGRTGRAGKKGASISIVHSREVKKIRDIERITGKKFEKKKIPNGKEICEKQLFNQIDKMENININDSKIEEFMPDIYKKLDWLDKEELIKRFVSVEFNRFLDYYKDAVDINIDEDKRKSKTSKNKGREREGNSKRSRGGNFSRFYINVGTQDGLTAPKMIGLINDNCKSRNIEIGKIDLMKRFSFFEVDKEFEKTILKGFKNSDFGGRSLNVEVSKPENKKVRKR